MGKKLPAFQFYPGDWLKDPALRSVSVAARGLWIDLLCLMHESPRRGYLQHANGKPVTTEQIARMTGCSAEEVSQLLQELEYSGVFSCTEHGVIYSRRTVRDEAIREKRREAGLKGGNPVLLKQNASKRQANGKQTGNQNPTPSSSSSSSVSTSVNSPPKSPPLARGGRGLDWAAVDFPPGVADTAELRRAVEEWLEYRRTIGKPYRMAEKQISLLLADYGNSIIEAIRHSMAMGWQGCIHPDKEPKHGRYAAGPGQRHPADVAMRGW
ncbi:MAG: hypothetical protein Kow0040_14930 [Thermogutta sp.]